jgi:hypothetical protein
MLTESRGDPAPTQRPAAQAAPRSPPAAALRPAVQGPLPALAALHQRHPADPARRLRRRPVGGDGRGRRLHLVPAMIYLLRMPAPVVVGTSLFQIVITTS